MAPDEMILTSNQGDRGGESSSSSPSTYPWQLDPRLQPKLTNWAESALLGRGSKAKGVNHGKSRKAGPSR